MASNPSPDPLAGMPIQFAPVGQIPALDPGITLFMIRQALMARVGRVHVRHVFTDANGQDYYEAFGYCGPAFLVPHLLPLEGRLDELEQAMLFVAVYVNNGIVNVYAALRASQEEIDEHA